MPSPSPAVTPPPGTVEGGVITFFVIALLVVPFIGAISSIYLWRLYYLDPERPRSWVVFRLALGATVTEICSTLVAVLVIRRLAGIAFGTEGTLILGLAILVLEMIPPMFAVAAWRLRHS